LLPAFAPKLSGTSAPATGAIAENPEFGPVPAVSSLNNIGLICFCIYVLSAFGNDLMQHVGGKAYLSWVFGPLCILVLLVRGTATRGLRVKIGKLWIGFAACLLFSTLFSLNKAASMGMVQDYFSRTLIAYFCCTAFGVTIRNVHKLVMLNVICATLLILEGILFGGPDETGRMSIVGSNFLGNANDFALGLVCSLGFSLYLIWRKSGILRILGFAQFLVTLYFMLGTGSRGGFLALVGCLTVWFLFSGKRGTIIALILPGLAAIPMVSGGTLARLVNIEVPGSIASTAEGGAELSQLERTHLLQVSIRFAVTHPVFGTGPGTFRDALYYDDVAHGTHTPSLNTHNSWTEVASECGFPALICYAMIVFGSIRICYRIMRRTQKEPGTEKVFAISACLLGSLVAYAIGSTFDHVAYGMTLPLLSGMAIALHLATRGGDPNWIRSEDALGNA
jgi:hypothetical protein